MKKYISLFLATLVFLTSTLFAVPASAQAATLKINSVTAASVSTGVDSGITYAIQDIINQGVQIGLPIAGTAIAGPGGAFLGAAGSKLVSLASSKITSMAEKIGQKFPDELYINIDGKKVWPTPNPKPKYQEIKRGEKIDLNLTTNFTKEANVVLWEYDTIGSDDNLGQQTFKTDSPSGEYMLFSKDEGSVYFLNVSVTP